MKARNRCATGARLAAAAVGAAAAAYATHVGRTWYRYGHADPPENSEVDSLLDRFMPDYDVAERHHIHVNAPQSVTLAAACEQDVMRSPIARMIFRVREAVLGAPHENRVAQGVLAEVLALGWVKLAEVPGREVVVGAVTRPWEADIVFRSVSAERFAAFNEPGYVKIVWNLRADPAGDGGSIFRTETRVIATDAEAREKFRVYWAFFSAGVTLIRQLLLGPVKVEAERRAARH